ncbi:MAG: two-component system, OmpR family, sensor histidine kinase ChvG [Rhodospirillaceae bacterium]|jgi:two-component system sensor histidine kinase ChvG|nr:two-component system, OmpR family, sensor histidine kinase ChvG [Rhodospirillaceae bacterium]
MAFWRFRRSISSKLVLLVVIFLTVPFVLYQAFRRADEEKRALLIQSIQNQGEIIAAMLRPALQAFDQKGVADLGEWLKGIPVHGLHVKILLHPTGSTAPQGFYYIAAEPALPPTRLVADSRELMATGVFGRLTDSCEGGFPLAKNYTNESGEHEVLTSLTSIQSPAGCWVVITSNSTADMSGVIANRPYWSSPEVQFGALVYFLMAAVVLWLLLGVRGDLGRFALQAQRIRERRGGSSFVDLNRVPELAGIADEFDRMVRSLEQSAKAVREAAEESAHALKTPIGVIAQSLEPLRSRIAGTDAEGQRSIDFIQRSVDRLGNLVSFTRQFGEATADLMDMDRSRVDLSSLVRGMLADYRMTAARIEVEIVEQVTEGIDVMGSLTLLEPVLENIIDNALSFSPRGSKITVVLQRARQNCRLTISDEGPGVVPEDLPRLFERYYSSRPEEYRAAAHADGEPLEHFGLGLWVVRRNVDALGGQVTAVNRQERGLAVIVNLPLAYDH